MKVVEEIHPPIDRWRNSFVTDWKENWLFISLAYFSPACIRLVFASEQNADSFVFRNIKYREQEVLQGLVEDEKYLRSTNNDDVNE